MPKVNNPSRAKGLPLPGAILVSAADYMLETPSIRWYSLIVSYPIRRVTTW